MGKRNKSNQLPSTRPLPSLGAPPILSLDMSNMPPFQKRLNEIFAEKTKEWMSVDNSHNPLESDKPKSDIAIMMGRWTEVGDKIKGFELEEQATYADMIIGTFCNTESPDLIAALAEDMIPHMDDAEWTASDYGNHACVILALRRCTEYKRFYDQMYAKFKEISAK